MSILSEVLREGLSMITLEDGEHFGGDPTVYLLACGDGDGCWLRPRYMLKSPGLLTAMSWLPRAWVWCWRFQQSLSSCSSPFHILIWSASSENKSTESHEWPVLLLVIPRFHEGTTKILNHLCQLRRWCVMCTGVQFNVSAVKCVSPCYGGTLKLAP